MAVTRVVRGGIRRHGKGMRPPFRACSGMSRPLHRGGACRPRCSPRHLHRVCLPCTRPRHRAAPCRLEPAWCSSACTTRRRQSRAEGRRDSSVQVGFPYASVVVHASANRYPSTPRRAPDRRRLARPWRPGARGGATARLPTWPVSPCQGRTHLIGRNSPDTRGERGTGLRTRGVDGCGSPTLPARVGQTYAAQKGVWNQRISLRRCERTLSLRRKRT